jgi:hypothetical protein
MRKLRVLLTWAQLIDQQDGREERSCKYFGPRRLQRRYHCVFFLASLFAWGLRGEDLGD